MIDAEILESIASQLMTRSSVHLEGNPDKSSRWGQLARSGHHVVQFKDVEQNKFVAVVVDGKVTFYGSGKKRP